MARSLASALAERGRANFLDALAPPPRRAASSASANPPNCRAFVRHPSIRQFRATCRSFRQESGKNCGSAFQRIQGRGMGESLQGEGTMGSWEGGCAIQGDGCAGLRRLFSVNWSRNPRNSVMAQDRRRETKHGSRLQVFTSSLPMIWVGSDGLICLFHALEYNQSIAARRRISAMVCSIENKEAKTFPHEAYALLQISSRYLRNVSLGRCLPSTICAVSGARLETSAVQGGAKPNPHAVGRGSLTSVASPIDAGLKRVLEELHRVPSQR